MKSTTLLANMALSDLGPRVLDVSSLLSRLETLVDLRHRKGRRYALAVALALIVLAKLSGEDQPSGIANWIALRRRELVAGFRLSWERMPHHNTYRRVIADAVDPDQFDQVVGEFLGGLPGVGQSVLVSIDGKTVRGTIDQNNPRGEHLLAAYLPQEGIVLFQVACGTKENEISTAPKLLAGIDLRGKVVCGDAEQTQRQLSSQILEAGGDYLWFVKDNQPTLRQDIEFLFEADDRTVLGARVPNDFRTSRTVEKGHGRRETREITVSGELKGYSEFPGLEQVFKLERRRTNCKTGQGEREVVYGLTSLSQAKSPADRLLDLSRAYWGIENGLHRRRDVTFREDATRLTQGHAGRVMATLNNLAIGLLRQAGHSNLAQARRECAASLTQTLSLLTSSLIT